FRLTASAAAGSPVLPGARGIAVTKIHLVLYILAFMAATLARCLGGYAGYGYLLVAVAVSRGWLAIALTGYWTADDRLW
ncbi:protoheme IX farnesyltransferase, partial [Pseudomonas paraeruginosa]